MSTKKTNGTSTPMPINTQMNTESKASHDKSTKKRKVDDSNNDESLNYSDISSAQSNGNAVQSNINSSSKCNNESDRVDEIVPVSFKTTYEYFSKESEASKWVCNECTVM